MKVIRFASAHPAFALAIALTASLISQPALSAGVEEFYKGRTISLVIGYSGGGGYGLWNQENTAFTNGPPSVQFSATTTTGGRGYFGTLGGGCDYQFPALGTQFVIGAFGDYDFASLNGKVNPPAVIGALGDERMSSAWSIGGRIGWLASPSLLTYVSAGYTEADLRGGIGRHPAASRSPALPRYRNRLQRNHTDFIGCSLTSSRNTSGRA